MQRNSDQSSQRDLARPPPVPGRSVRREPARGAAEDDAGALLEYWSVLWRRRRTILFVSLAPAALPPAVA